MNAPNEPRLGLPPSPPTEEVEFDVPVEEPPSRVLATPADRATSSSTTSPGTGWKWAAVGMAGAVVGTLLTFGLLSATGAFDSQTVAAPAAAPLDRVVERTTVIDAASGAELAPADRVRDAALAAIPSVVTVEVFSSAGEPLSGIGTGSGVIFTEDGYILTNDHVITGAAQVRVVRADGLAYDARVVGSDPVMDIAVLDIDASGLPAIQFGDVSALEIGDLTVAVGNPLGLDGGPSVTAGVVSAFDRRLETNAFGNDLYGLLQTDAPITRGSSGGALINGDAELIGITTAIGLSDVGAEGLGFAVPINLVEGLIDDILRDGLVRHAYLGIEGAPAFQTRADGAEVPIGARINRILSDSVLGDAGAQINDVIVAIAGEPIASMTLLVARLRQFRAGEEIDITVTRDGSDTALTVVLDERPEN